MTGVAATTLQKTTRYYPAGHRAVIFCDAVANPAAATLAEINAGTDLTPEIVEGGVTGFKMTPSTMDAPDLGSNVSRKVAGRTTLDDSSLMLYASVDSQDARTFFTAGQTGFVLIFPEGTEATTPPKLYDIHPVTVQQVYIDQDTTKLGQFQVDFAPSDVPHTNIPIPTV